MKNLHIKTENDYYGVLWQEKTGNSIYKVFPAFPGE